MPKKSKKNAAPEEHLEEPVAIPPPAEVPAVVTRTELPPPPESDWQWPDSTETRELIVAHDDHARSEIGLQMGKLQEAKEDIEAQKKAANSAFKAQLDGLEERMSKYAATLKAGGEKSDVECRWIFEVSGLTADGWTRHPEYKTLVRLDTGEVVHTVKITEQDRQATLNLGDDEEALTAALNVRGYHLSEREAPAEGEAPFFIEVMDGEPGNYRDVRADNRLGALRAALAMTAPLPQPDAYNEGAAAFADQKERDAVPYEAGTEARAAWLSGYDDERAIKEAA